MINLFSVFFASVQLDVVAGSTAAPLLSNITLACEMHGYFPPPPSPLPEIMWLRGSDPVDLSSGSYSVSTREGSALIQNGGETTLPSVISELEIFVQDESVYGTYLCRCPL